MTKKKPMNRDEMLKKIAAPPEKIVDVPGIGAIRIKVPNFERLMEIRGSILDKTEQTYSVILAHCPDLMPEDLDAIKAGSGLAVGALLTAISEIDKPLTDEAVGKPSRR